MAVLPVRIPGGLRRAGLTESSPHGTYCCNASVTVYLEPVPIGQRDYYLIEHLALPDDVTIDKVTRLYLGGITGPFETPTQYVPCSPSLEGYDTYSSFSRGGDQTHPSRWAGFRATYIIFGKHDDVIVED